MSVDGGAKESKKSGHIYMMIDLWENVFFLMVELDGGKSRSCADKGGT